MFGIRPESGGGKMGLGRSNRSRVLRVIWLPIPFRQWAEWLPDNELAVVVRAATTSGRGLKAGSTGIRGILTPQRAISRASGAGSRSASAAARSTTRATVASATYSQRRMPRPRISISPASSRAGRTHNFSPSVSRWTRSSPTRIAGGSCPVRPARTRSNARRDLPAPDGPRISTAQSPTFTADACTVVSALIARAASRRSARR